MVAAHVSVIAIAAVACAPAILVTSYGDAPDGGSETTRTVSLLGLETSLWLWLGVTAVGVLAVTATTTLLRRRTGAIE